MPFEAFRTRSRVEQQPRGTLPQMDARGSHKGDEPAVGREDDAVERMWLIVDGTEERLPDLAQRHVDQPDSDQFARSGTECQESAVGREGMNLVAATQRQQLLSCPGPVHLERRRFLTAR